MTLDKIPPAPAKDDSDTDTQTSTQVPTSSESRSRQRPSTNAGVKKHPRRNRNRNILLKTILPRPMDILPTSTIPASTVPAPTLSAPKLPPREPDLYDEVMAILQPRVTRVLQDSALGKVKAMLGDWIGIDDRKRPEIRREGTNIFGNVDGQYKPAVWHDKNRDKLILIDAQQAGAPAWQPDMPLDYTSYSPLTSGWTKDPATIRDARGRQVCLMDEPPNDWRHNPKKPYLMFEDKFVLDVNNRPIKDYKGAPLAISTDAPPWLLEGLYRSFGMTNSDLRARMRPIRDTPAGPQRIQIGSHFTNRRNSWKNRNGVKQWQGHVPKQSNETVNNPSGVEDEKVKDEDKDQEEEKPSSMPESTPTQAMDIDDTYLALAIHDLSAMPGPSSATTASHGFMQNQTRHRCPSVSQNELYSFEGARDISSNPCGGQSEIVEQSREATWANARTFPAANMPMSNTIPTTGINTTRYPSQFSQQNIYGPGPSSAMTASHGFMQNQTRHRYPSISQNELYSFEGARDISSNPYCGGQSEFVEQSREATWANARTFPAANMPVSNANSTATGINSARYPIQFFQQNIYAGQGPMSIGAYSYGQPTIGYGEQTWGDNRVNAPTFPMANPYAQTANNVPLNSTNTATRSLLNTPANTHAASAHPSNHSPLYTTPSSYDSYNQSIAPTPNSNYIPAPANPVRRPILGGYNQPDLSNRHAVDIFWDQEMGLQEPQAVNSSAQVQATPQPAGPRRPQPLNLASPAPRLSLESADTTLSSPAEDPFVGAEYSPVSPDDWLNSDELWQEDGWR